VNTSFLANYLGIDSDRLFTFIDCFNCHTLLKIYTAAISWYFTYFNNLRTHKIINNFLICTDINISIKIARTSKWYDTDAGITVKSVR